LESTAQLVGRLARSTPPPVALRGGLNVVRVACPVCGEGVELELIPDRLPVEVPMHAALHGGACPGSGRATRDAWMVRLPAAPAQEVRE
jgi:hypothetical protein